MDFYTICPHIIVAIPKMPIPGRRWQGYFLDPDQNVFGIFEVNENAK
jgi:hypothetical protein